MKIMYIFLHIFARIFLSMLSRISCTNLFLSSTLRHFPFFTQDEKMFMQRCFSLDVWDRSTWKMGRQDDSGGKKTMPHQAPEMMTRSLLRPARDHIL